MESINVRRDSSVLVGVAVVGVFLGMLLAVVILAFLQERSLIPPVPAWQLNGLSIFIMLVIAAYIFKKIAAIEKLWVSSWLAGFYNEPFRKLPWYQLPIDPHVSFVDIVALLEEEQFRFFYVYTLIAKGVLMVDRYQYDDVEQCIKLTFPQSE